MKQQQIFESLTCSAPTYEGLSTLAEKLALQAGEEVRRPLSQAQLARAVQVHMEESEILRQLLLSHAKALAEMPEWQM